MSPPSVSSNETNRNPDAGEATHKQASQPSPKRRLTLLALGYALILAFLFEAYGPEPQQPLESPSIGQILAFRLSAMPSISASTSAPFASPQATGQGASFQTQSLSTPKRREESSPSGKTLAFAAKERDQTGGHSNEFYQRRAMEFLQGVDLGRYYPKRARRLGREGLVTLALHLEEGQILDDSKLAHSSDWPELNRAALKLLDDYRSELREFLFAKGLPKAESIRLELPIRFSLQEARSDHEP